MTKILLFFLFVTLIMLPSISLAYNLNDTLSIEATLTTVIQHANVENSNSGNGHKYSDTTRSSESIDISANFHPTENNEFQLTYSFAEGEAVNGLNAFTLAPYADDLEEDLSDINNSGRYNLLEAWYKHDFQFNQQTSFGITAGIIGSTSFIDDNEYANDEISQFMNDIFVNNTLANLPDYDLGTAIELTSSNWTWKAIYMHSENDDLNDYNYYALQLGYHTETIWGPGNYRIYGYTTDDEFIGTDTSNKENLAGIGVSIDQQVSESVGMFVRLGIQEDQAPIDHDKMASVGLSIMGSSWNRSADSLGIGIAYLDGASSSGVIDTVSFESYYKFVFSDNFDLSIDAQWIKDKIPNESDTTGAIIGLRFNAYM